MSKKLTPQQALEKIRHYCAYQERAHMEVRNRLFEYGLYRSEVDEILTSLITEGFLNEERFARAFAGGKFRMKKWGKIKIVHELEGKGITKNCIKAGLSEIDDDAYIQTLGEVLQGKLNLQHQDSNNTFIARDKLARYAIQKGYEPELVWKYVKELMPEL